MNHSSCVIIMMFGVRCDVTEISLLLFSVLLFFWLLDISNKYTEHNRIVTESIVYYAVFCVCSQSIKFFHCCCCCLHLIYFIHSNFLYTHLANAFLNFTSNVSSTIRLFISNKIMAVRYYKNCSTRLLRTFFSQ